MELEYVDSYTSQGVDQFYLCVYRPQGLSDSNMVISAKKTINQQEKIIRELEVRVIQLQDATRRLTDKIGLDYRSFMDIEYPLHLYPDQQSQNEGEDDRSDGKSESKVDKKSNKAFPKPKRLRIEEKGQRLKIIRKYYDMKKRGMSMHRFCQIYRIAERTLRRWINKK